MTPAGAVVAGDACAGIRRLDEAGLRACIAEAAPAAERRLAPAAGVMVAAVWFDAGAQAHLAARWGVPFEDKRGCLAFKRSVHSRMRSNVGPVRRPARCGTSGAY